MIWLEFGGWFQCRLATDPDPSDEPRGVSGYVHAVAGEPDLDRIIRLQRNGACPRSHCPQIGVVVKHVFEGSKANASSPVIGAEVELLDNPKFEGRNHIIAEDGFEAIVPFHLKISKGSFVLQRKFSDNFVFPPKAPPDRDQLQTLQAGGVVISPGTIGVHTGIFDLGEVWRGRINLLQADLNHATSEVEQAALRSRIASLSDPRNLRFFGARMLYSIPLDGTSVVRDPGGWLSAKPSTGAGDPWLTELWYGAWDPDALCGFMQGYLGLPTVQSVPTSKIAAMMTDPNQERR